MIKNILQKFTIGACLLVLLYPFYDVTQKIIPLKLVKQESVIEKNLATLGAPTKHREEISKAIDMASKQTGVPHQMITALMCTESRFDPEATSSLNYQGLMQIPWKIKYIDANVLIGTRIFVDKLAYTKGNVRNAIIIYKGWKVQDKKGQFNADKVLQIRSQLT